MQCLSQVDIAWINDRITATKTEIVAYEDAVLKLGAGAQSYSLSTGQTTQQVTKANLGQLQASLASLENRLQYYQNKLNGGANSYGRAGF
jgi:hypothetical protein